MLGIEGVEVSDGTERLPPILRAGRGSQESHRPSPIPCATLPRSGSKSRHRCLIENPVRSGQSVVYIDGDVTILGSVGSGAEIIAGGSIHVYGTLRGQAMAGATGNPRARIFCHRFEAELLAIGAYYKTADEIEEGLRRGPVQAWLDGKTLRISAIN